MKHVDLRISDPKHGWVRISLRLGAFELDCVASNVLNDPIQELLDVEQFLADPSVDDVRACLWLEPEGYALDFVRGDSPSTISVKVSFDENFVPPMRRSELRETLLEAQFDRRKMLDSWSGCFADLFFEVGLEELELWNPGQSYQKRHDAIDVALQRLEIS